LVKGAGLNALTVGLAGAFGPRVRANAILPGAVLTDIARAWSADRLKRAGGGCPSAGQASPRTWSGLAPVAHRE
jgi:NAD(P)-dependent dehydrogenase (short-subunit alcohol dehydrogenase family)